MGLVSCQEEEIRTHRHAEGRAGEDTVRWHLRTQDRLWGPKPALAWGLPPAGDMLPRPGARAPVFVAAAPANRCQL